jgi:hypothetical protein
VRHQLSVNMTRREIICNDSQFELHSDAVRCYAGRRYLKPCGVATTYPEEVITLAVCLGTSKINAATRLQFGICSCTEGVLLYARRFTVQFSPLSDKVTQFLNFRKDHRPGRALEVLKFWLVL